MGDSPERVRPGTVFVPATTFTRAGKVIHRRAYWRRKPVYKRTPAQIAAARRNIEIARRRWMAMRISSFGEFYQTPRERAEAMPVIQSNFGLYRRSGEI
ncbi:MAG: hypothetical protein AB1485_07840 [Candidatus Thermoplasmatota archaeon]